MLDRQIIMTEGQVRFFNSRLSFCSILRFMENKEDVVCL